MERILSELWNGQICPAEHLGCGDEEIRNLERFIGDNADKLTKGLSEKQQTTFEKYVDCINEYISLSCERAFCEGFSCAVKIMTEAMAK
ncbi:MAG: hypothetical protein IJA55_06755 [Clostridia bacterium]|nr:hypothetical protein [Clostridia bacterium]